MQTSGAADAHPSSFPVPVYSTSPQMIRQSAPGFIKQNMVKIIWLAPHCAASPAEKDNARVAQCKGFKPKCVRIGEGNDHASQPLN